MRAKAAVSMCVKQGLNKRKNSDDKTASDFLTILEQRMGIRSLTIVGQVPIKRWHGQFSDPIKADTVMDRVINQSYIIELSGKSMREKYGAMAQIRQEAEHAKAATYNNEAGDGKSEKEDKAIPF